MTLGKLQERAEQARADEQRKIIEQGGSKVKVDALNIEVPSEPEPAKAPKTPKPKAEKVNYLEKAPDESEYDDVYTTIEQRLQQSLTPGVNETPTTVQPFLIKIMQDIVTNGSSKEKLVAKSMLTNGGTLDVSTIKLLQPTEESVKDVRKESSNFDALLELFDKGTYTLTDVAKLVGTKPECIWVYPLFIKNGWNDLGSLNFPTKKRNDKPVKIPRTAITTIGSFLKSQGVL